MSDRKLHDELLHFVRRRFQTDCHWLDGNCYYFAVILKDRFPGGKIFYDVINGHFVFWLDGAYYDWAGEINPDGYLVEWERFMEYDELVCQRVMEGCVE